MIEFASVFCEIVDKNSLITMCVIIFLIFPQLDVTYIHITYVYESQSLCIISRTYILIFSNERCNNKREN